MAKTYDELTFADDFLFCKVMSTNLDLCKDLLELILGIRIREVRLSESQKTIDMTADSKSVRLDVYASDSEDTVYDIEMQATKRTDLPKRSRYYQGMIDLGLIGKGRRTYKTLNKSFVIFICMFDPFGRNLPIYSFENICLQDETLKLNDETTKVFVNAKCSRQDIPKDIKNLLEYLRDNKAEDPFTESLDAKVRRARTQEEWRLEYMTLEMKINEAYEDGKEQGIERGIEQIVTAMLRNGKTPSEIHDLCDISLEEIERIEGKLLAGASRK